MPRGFCVAPRWRPSMSWHLRHSMRLARRRVSSGPCSSRRSAPGPKLTPTMREPRSQARRCCRSRLDWVILRPSLIVAKGSYGGTSLLRGLAGLPLVTPLAGDGSHEFSPLHAEDLTRTVRIACETERFDKQVLEP